MARAGSRTSQCRVCQHAERGRIDYLAATGAPLTPLAERFGLAKDSLHRHFARHVTPEFKRAAKVGPFESEEQLRRLRAESGVSVIENLRAIYSGLMARWLISIEAGADNAMTGITGRLHENLTMQAKITHELVPTPSSVTVNAFMSPDWFQGFSAALMDFARRHPEVREDLAPVLRTLLNPNGQATPLNITPSARDAA